MYCSLTLIMANIAVARIKREFKEVVKSEEVCVMSLIIAVMMMTMMITITQNHLLYVA